VSRSGGRGRPTIEACYAQDRDGWRICPAWSRNPDDELVPPCRAEVSTDPVAYVRYRREYLGWGVFAC